MTRKNDHKNDSFSSSAHPFPAPHNVKSNGKGNVNVNGYEKGQGYIPAPPISLREIDYQFSLERAIDDLREENGFLKRRVEDLMRDLRAAKDEIEEMRYEIGMAMGMDGPNEYERVSRDPR